MTAVEMLTKPLAHHGEGPVWVARDTSLYWVDMLAGDVLQLDSEGQVSRHHVGSVAAALRPRTAGGLVVAVERGFALVEPDWTMRELPEAFADVSIRMNDGGCDPQGRFYCGTMAYDVTPGAGKLFRLDPDESVHVVLDGVTVSNGLAWSPDGATVYYVDSDTQRIDAFDFDAGSAAFQNRRTVVKIDPDLGSPDGLTVDEEGGLWVALWDGAAVHRYSPEGRLAEVLELPTPRVSACTFGGERLDQLFITTSALNLDASHEVAGAVFCAEPGVAGLPVSCYAVLPPRLRLTSQSPPSSAPCLSPPPWVGATAAGRRPGRRRRRPRGGRRGRCARRRSSAS